MRRRIENPLLRTGNTESNLARLVLQTGSRAGLQAPLHPGYYMIGRHKECQIRPKSRSVSRHHCLLHHDEGVVRVLDLESTSGTRINEEKLTPKSWVPLADGDLLRCGKIVFRVSVEAARRQPAGGSVVAVGAASAGSGSMVSGEAWQEVDIADYLGSEDDADRERRYDSIREQSDARESARQSDSSDEVDIFADDFDDDLPTDVSGESSATSRDIGGSRSVARSTAASGDANESPAGATKRDKPIRIPKSKRKRLSRSRASLFDGWGDPERLKMLGAILLTIAMLGYFGYSFYHHYNGPDVRVLEGID